MATPTRGEVRERQGLCISQSLELVILSRFARLCVLLHADPEVLQARKELQELSDSPRIARGRATYSFWDRVAQRYSDESVRPYLDMQDRLKNVDAGMAVPKHVGARLLSFAFEVRQRKFAKILRRFRKLECEGFEDFLRLVKGGDGDLTLASKQMVIMFTVARVGMPDEDAIFHDGVLKTDSENIVLATLSQKRGSSAASLQVDREPGTVKRRKADGDAGELSVAPNVSSSPSSIASTFQSVSAVPSCAARSSIPTGKTMEGGGDASRQKDALAGASIRIGFMKVVIDAFSQYQRVLNMVSSKDHCLAKLARQQFEELKAEFEKEFKI